MKRLLLLALLAWTGALMVPAQTPDKPFTSLLTAWDALQKASGLRYEDWERPVDFVVRVLDATAKGSPDLLDAYWKERLALEGTGFPVASEQTKVVWMGTKDDAFSFQVQSTSPAFPFDAVVSAVANTAADKKALEALVKAKNTVYQVTYRYRWVNPSQFKVMANSLKAGPLTLTLDGENAPMFLVSATAPTLTSPYQNTLIKTALVEGGTGTMRLGENGLKHKVTLTGFRMELTEMTMDTFYDLMRKTDPLSMFYKSRSKPYNPDDRYPWVGGSWMATIHFLNERSRVDGLEPVYTIVDEATANIAFDFRRNGWRLPTDAEFIWASRGGVRSHGYAYSGGNKAREVAWIDQNDKIGGTTTVASLKPNELGLYDLSGNAWEFTWDWSGPVPAGDLVDPTGPTQPSGEVPKRTVRGSTDGKDLNMLRIENSRFGREFNLKEDVSQKVGFRMVRR